jgi:hypothetical protein
MNWWHSVIAAGATPAAFTPPPGWSRAASEPGGGDDAIAADIVEGTELEIHPVPAAAAAAARIPKAVSFLNGWENWSVVAYDGVVPLVHAYVAAAVRRREERAVLRTTLERTRQFAVAPLEALHPERRAALAAERIDLEPIGAGQVGQPAAHLDAVEAVVRRARVRLERELAEACLARLGGDEWLVVDGLLSLAPAVARHPRAIGVIRSHGVQFLEGRGLERALTLPVGHRTSVFRVQGGHSRTEVYSWYLRLWPWEGNELLYGLLRVETRAHPDVVARASELSGWLFAERAPLATPDARWDRLLYPLHHVEEYLKSRAPRAPHRVARLPKTGT